MDKKKQKKKELLLPALRAQIGSWKYFISSMRMQDIADRINYAEEIHKRKELNELLQRQVSARKKYIVKYLETQEQRFFNSIIVGVYKGSPEWYELAIGKNKHFDPDNLPEYMEGVIGFLKLSGSEELFAIDGQHRVAGIREAVRKNEKFNDEEVSVIFVSAKMDTKGKQKTRRLFSTLNRYAKQVKRSYIIALNEDDAVAIITRKLIEDHPFFKNDKIYLESKNIRKTDFDNFTSLEALYDSLDVYLCDKKKSEWENYKTIYPGDDEIDHYYKSATQIMNKLVSSFAVLKGLSKTSNNSKVIKKYRGDHGGHLIYRPVGLIIIFHAIKLAKEANMNIDIALKRIALMQSNLTDEPWSKLLWDKARKRMYPTINKDRHEVAAQLIFYMIHGNLAAIKLSEDKLQKSYAKAIDWDEEKNDKLPLPRQIRARISTKKKKKRL